MKIRFLLLSLAIGLATLPVMRAEDPKPAPPAAKPETELEKTMTKMGKAWRQVRKAARDGQLTPAMADAVATVRANAEAAAKLTPALESEQPEAARAKFQADYQAKMKKLVEALTKLEATLKANDLSGATKLVGEVGDLMKTGHRNFKKPDETH